MHRSLPQPDPRRQKQVWSLGSGYPSQISLQLFAFDMRLMTCSECESMRLIILVLLHRCASTSNRDPLQQAGSNATGRILDRKSVLSRRGKQPAPCLAGMDDLIHLRGHAAHSCFLSAGMYRILVRDLHRLTELFPAMWKKVITVVFTRLVFNDQHCQGAGALVLLV